MTDLLVSAAILLPLSGALVMVFFGKQLGEPWAGYLGTLTVVAAFGGAAIAAADFFTGTGETVVVRWFDWFPAFGVAVELRWDPLSALMTLVVTGVGSLIHLYSIGYMHGDARFGRFFTYLNLFVASMLILVLANNFAVMFVGWELVGLCSYLLISFWFEKETAAAAGKKAFVVNRVGDVGFIVALMLVFSHFGTFSFDEVLEGAGGLAAGTATAIGLLLLVGAAGKSAQAAPLRVAARCDGGSDSGVGPHPRRHHGHRRCVPGGAPLRSSLRPRWRVRWSPSSAPPLRCSPRLSPSRSETSNECSPTRRSRSSGSCSWLSVPPPMSPACST